MLASPGERNKSDFSISLKRDFQMRARMDEDGTDSSGLGALGASLGARQLWDAVLTRWGTNPEDIT